MGKNGGQNTRRLQVTSRSRQWTIRYALLAYGVSWIVVGWVSLGMSLPFGVSLSAGAGALCISMAWLASLIPLYHADMLRLVDLGIRPTPAVRSIGLIVCVFGLTSLFDGLWRSALMLGPVVNPFSGVPEKSTATIVVTGLAAIVIPVVEEVFFRGLLYKSFRNRLGVFSSSVIVGVMFGLVHTDYPLIVLPELAFYGGLACLLYEYTGSLLPGIAINMYLDMGGFEVALDGKNTVALLTFSLVFLVIVAHGLRSILRRSCGCA